MEVYPTPLRVYFVPTSVPVNGELIKVRKMQIRLRSRSVGKDLKKCVESVNTAIDKMF